MILPPESVTGIGALEEQFLASMNQLAEAGNASPVTAATPSWSCARMRHRTSPAAPRLPRGRLGLTLARRSR